MIRNTLLTNLFCISDNIYDKEGYLLIFEKDLINIDESVFSHLWYTLGIEYPQLKALINPIKFKYRKLKYVSKHNESFLIKPIQ